MHREVLLAASSTEKWADRPQKLNLGLQLAPQLVEALMTSGSYSRSHCALEEDRPRDRLRCDANVLNPSEGGGSHSLSVAPPRRSLSQFATSLLRSHRKYEYEKCRMVVCPSHQRYALNE